MEAAHPRATFVALADDDVYIQYPHMVADLTRFVHDERQQPEELVLWYAPDSLPLSRRYRRTDPHFPLPQGLCVLEALFQQRHTFRGGGD